MSKKNEVIMTNEEIIEVENVAEEPKMGLAGKVAMKVSNLSNHIIEKSKAKAEKAAAEDNSKKKVRKVVAGVVVGTATVGGIAYGIYKVISGKSEDNTVNVEYSDNGFSVTENEE